VESVHYVNALSIDLESWVHRDNIITDRKEVDNGFIVKSTREILNILNRYNAKATFFIVSEIFEWYPELIYEIKNRGFEIAYHTYSHKIITSDKILNEEIKKSEYFLKKFKPIGFRASKIFLNENCLKILAKHGFKYDSSIYAPLGPRVTHSGIIELPVSTYNLIGKPKLSFPKPLSYSLFFKEIPFGSGYMLGILGSKISHFIKNNNKKGIPTFMFVHPWQIIEVPKSKATNFFRNGISSIPYYINRKRSLEKLLEKYKFSNYCDVITDLGLLEK
tara:strand:- start:675 stop:1502 length:828 start_codon:yes stop_codon:yes gene_type:complete